MSATDQGNLHCRHTVTSSSHLPTGPGMQRSQWYQAHSESSCLRTSPRKIKVLKTRIDLGTWFFSIDWSHLLYAFANNYESVPLKSMSKHQYTLRVLVFARVRVSIRCLNLFPWYLDHASWKLHQRWRSLYASFEAPFVTAWALSFKQDPFR